MDIGAQVQSHTVGRTALYIADCYYTITEQGVEGKRPIIHLCGMDKQGEYHHLRVTGYKPYFFAPEDEFIQQKNDVETEKNTDDPRIIDHEFGYSGLVRGGSESCVKIICTVPWDVAQIRQWFTHTWEADVLFHNRFMADVGINSACTVPADRDEIAPDDIEPIDDPLSCPCEPRVCTVDIEVSVGEGGFPDQTLADRPVTAITAHDSYTNDYWTGVLTHPKWDTDEMTKRSLRSFYDDRDDITGECELFAPGRDDALLNRYNEWMLDRQPGILLAWNISFDTPYIVNRSLDNGIENIMQLSPTGDVEKVDNPTWDTEDCISGVESVDAIEAYKKTTIGSLKSKALEDIAQKELDYGKEDIDGYDETWSDEPEAFVKYSIRDVQAVVEIMAESGGLDLFQHIQGLSGTQFVDIDSNKRIVDNALLRKALGTL